MPTVPIRPVAGGAGQAMWRGGGGCHDARGLDGSDGWGGRHCVVELTQRAMVSSVGGGGGVKWSRGDILWCSMAPCETLSGLSHTARGVTEGDAHDPRETASG